MSEGAAPARLGAGRRIAWASLAIVSLGGFAIVFVPAFLIRPFTAQSPRGLEISFVLRRWSPGLTIATTAAALALAVGLFRGSRGRLPKAALIAAAGLALFSAWFARQNHFEWMFHPLAGPAYAKAEEADFVADADMVLSLKMNGEAAAWPIRVMAYHHLVQDVVGGTPVVATY